MKIENRTEHDIVIAGVVKSKAGNEERTETKSVTVPAGKRGDKGAVVPGVIDLNAMEETLVMEAKSRAESVRYSFDSGELAISGGRSAKEAAPTPTKSARE